MRAANNETRSDEFSTRDAHLRDGRLGQQDAADGLGGCDDLLDQHTVEKRNETLGHLVLGDVREKDCASALYSARRHAMGQSRCLPDEL